MIAKSNKQGIYGNRLPLFRLVLFAVGLFFVANEAFAAYTVTINQRRMGDQIGVEFWMKAAPGDPALGQASISVIYNSKFLTPDGSNAYETTDSVEFDINQATAVPVITSNFGVTGGASYGYEALAGSPGTSMGINYHQLDIRLSGGGTGLTPATTGRGSYLGMIKFDIVGTDAFSTMTTSDLTEIAFNTADALHLKIFDATGNNITGTTTFTNPSSFPIMGVTLLSPNGGEALNRNPSPGYLCLPTACTGYPIFFERSGLGYDGFGTTKYGYLLQYSLDGGTTYREIGRVGETPTAYAAMTAAQLAAARSGEIDSVSSTAIPANYHFITTGAGAAITLDYGGVLRAVWSPNENFPFRSENAMLRIVQVDSSSAVPTDITLRSQMTTLNTGRADITNSTFTLGRLFFVQLDGTSQYFRTRYNVSTSSWMTVEAWINLNSIQSTAGAEPAILASSGGEASTEEGAWMLYLSEGKYPAFRAREIEGRGPSGYIATVVSPTSLTIYSDATPLTDGHSQNWVHIAATVKDNVITLFVNGEQVAQETNNYATNIRLLSTLHPVWVGVNPNLGIHAQDYLNAGIKEARVWKTALPQDYIKSRIAGVFDPAGIATPFATINDDREYLELDYTFQGIRSDVASNIEHQNSANPINYYLNPSITAVADNNSINYRPDRPHLTMTSPVGGEGISNLQDKSFNVRWVGYGLGSVAPASSDLLLQFSRDGGTSWFDCNGKGIPSYPLDTLDIERGTAYWEPYNNATTVTIPSGAPDDLQAVVPIDGNYTKSVMLRLSGTTERGQESIYSQSGAFQVAPYFALKTLASNKIIVPGSNSLNLTGAYGYIEAWIKPYNLPTGNSYYPIVSKRHATVADSLHYALRLMPNGTLQFVIGSVNSGVSSVRTANSAAALPLYRPNNIIFDSVWTHVGVWFNLANGGTSPSVYFYIDGTVQKADSIATQYATQGPVVPLISNTWPTYLGYEPIPGGTDQYFLGELKEIRFWSNNPAGQAAGTEPSNLSKFIQGAQSIRADEFSTVGGVDYKQNLVAAFILNGGSFINRGIQNCLEAYPTSSGIYATMAERTSVTYNATLPFMKLVEPYYRQPVPNTQTDLRVRWVGFDYNRNIYATADSSFRNGANSLWSDLEISDKGGGSDTLTWHYRYVASKTYYSAYSNSMNLPTSDSKYVFPGTGSKSQYASILNVSKSNPDLNEDGTYGPVSDQGAVSASMTNGRLRMKGRSLINGYMLEYDNTTDDYGMVPFLRVESPLFDITPPSNFTVRVLLEGYHRGSASAFTDNLANSYATGGLQIKLYNNNVNRPGSLVATGESTLGGYSDDASAQDPTYASAPRGTDGSQFANVPFVFTNISDGRYFVFVDHINHLPVLSRYAAPFYYTGDDVASWDVESGWDFQNWTGTVDNAITEAEANENPPNISNKYTAYGNSEIDDNKPEYANTGLIYNDGLLNTILTPLASMVGGDCHKDGKIDGADRAKINTDLLGTSPASDITGDGVVNNFDRDIVFRNSNKVSSTREAELSITNGNGEGSDAMVPLADPNDVLNGVFPGNPALSAHYNQQMRDYLANGGTRREDEKGSTIMSGSVEYRVYASPTLNASYIDVPMYIQNVGGEWALGNSTFAITYNTSVMQFVEMVKTSDVIFNERPALGYGKTMSGPLLSTTDPISDARSIDIEYDSYTKLLGQAVPNTKTYLGTLRFLITRPQQEYSFSWSKKLCGVIAVDGRIVTGNGVFEPIESIIVARPAKIKYPNGGEAIKSGTSTQIVWSQPTVDSPVYIDYSIDNGASWARITSSPVNLSTEAYYWATPKVRSNECLIRIIDSETSTEVDRSDAAFSLLPSNADIARPSSSDPIYLGGVTDLIKWAVDDPSNIRFEFSEDGTDTRWTIVSSTVNSSTNQVSWALPSVNTKKAVVRMVNVTTGEVMATSTPFKILAGTVALNAPAANEVLPSGKSTNIKWSYKNVSNFDMQISYDGGANWQDLQREVSAIKGYAAWLVPVVKTDNAIIRALWNNDPEMEYSRTKSFKITGSVGVEESGDGLFSFDRPVPNPFAGEAKLSFTVPYQLTVTMTMYNSAGMVIATLIDGKDYQAGTYNYTLNGTNLPAGVYYINLNAGMFNMTREVVLIK